MDIKNKNKFSYSDMVLEFIYIGDDKIVSDKVYIYI